MNGSPRNPQFEVIIHKYLVKLLLKLYQQGKYEQYTRRGATKNHGYYTDLKNAVNYEKARLGTRDLDGASTTCRRGVRFVSNACWRWTARWKRPETGEGGSRGRSWT